MVETPAPQQIIELRVFIQSKKGMGITDAQKYCASLIYKGLRTWQQWEAGDRKMDPALLELLKIKIDAWVNEMNQAYKTYSEMELSQLHDMCSSTSPEDEMKTLSRADRENALQQAIADKIAKDMLNVGFSHING